MCGRVVDEGLPLASGIRYGEASRPHRVFGNYQKSTYHAAYALTPPTHILQINLIWSFIEFLFLILIDTVPASIKANASTPTGFEPIYLGFTKSVTFKLWERRFL